MAPPLRQIPDAVLAGHRLTEEEAVRLLSTRDRGAWEIAAAADTLRERKVGDVVTYVCNRKINVSGLHPGFDAQSSVAIISWIRDEAPAEMHRMATGLGRTLRQRTMAYDLLLD